MGTLNVLIHEYENKIWHSFIHSFLYVSVVGIHLRRCEYSGSRWKRCLPMMNRIWTLNNRLFMVVGLFLVWGLWCGRQMSTFHVLPASCWCFVIFGSSTNAFCDTLNANRNIRDEKPSLNDDHLSLWNKYTASRESPRTVTAISKCEIINFMRFSSLSFSLSVWMSSSSSQCIMIGRVCLCAT